MRINASDVRINHTYSRGRVIISTRYSFDGRGSEISMVFHDSSELHTAISARKNVRPSVEAHLLWYTRARVCIIYGRAYIFARDALSPARVVVYSARKKSEKKIYEEKRTYIQQQYDKTIYFPDVLHSHAPFHNRNAVLAFGQNNIMYAIYERFGERGEITYKRTAGLSLAALLLYAQQRDDNKIETIVLQGLDGDDVLRFGNLYNTRVDLTKRRC